MWCFQITKVGQKRKREAETEEVEVQEDRHAWKKGRLGCASQEWITVYNKRQDFEQRQLPSTPPHRSFQSVFLGIRAHLHAHIYMA